MRFSTLTVVVFVAHTSTLAVAAPLPFPDEVQELVARGDDDPPPASGGNSGGASRWKDVATRVAKAVPPKLLNVPLHNNFASVVQKAVGAAAQGGSNQNHIRPVARPNTPMSPGLQKASSVLSKWKGMSPSAFPRPGIGSGPSLAKTPLQRAVAAMQNRKAHPVSSALQQSNKSKSPQASPARKALSLGRKALKVHKSTRKTSSASHKSKSTKASHAHKVSKVRKAATARKASKGKTAVGSKAKASASPKKALTSLKKTTASPKKASKLPKKRDLEIDELD